jgi:DNA-binding transcriptional MerR regulator
VSGEALTIGEVIGRLAADFPDLTVSKIRYLESGGLISPGRTPAGYRRFTEQDVEKLRWVLAAQRDQYLPLKVIRQHLAADGPRPGDDAEGIVAALTSAAGLGVGDPDQAQADSVPDNNASADSVPADGVPADGVPVGQAQAGRTQADSPERDRSDGDRSDGRGGASSAAAVALPPPATLTPPLPPIPQPRTRAVTVADPEFYEAAQADAGELHLGREGLARTASVPESFLSDLISFGLLPHAESFGGDAVFVVRAAWALSEFGLEPRHLRPLLTGARNTAGLLEGLLPGRRHDGVSTSGRQAAATRAAARGALASAAAVRLFAALLRAELAGGGPGRGSGAGAAAVSAAGAAPMSAPGAKLVSAPVSAPQARASRESSRNPGMPGGAAAR